MARRRPNRQTREAAPTAFPSQRELVVVASRDAGFRSAGRELVSLSGVNVRPLTQLLAVEGATMRPLFGATEDGVEAAVARLEAKPELIPTLSQYYRIHATDDRLDDLAREIREMDGIVAAYIKPAAEPPTRAVDAAPLPDEPSAATPDFSTRQIYLNEAPDGIDVHYARTRSGGSGGNLRIIDVEGAWRFSHEDLSQNQGGVVGGSPSLDLTWRNHGTAVIGQFSGDINGLGIEGICPDANVSAISIFPDGSAAAIRQAADRQRAGDILLIELHRPGPRFDFQSRFDQLGYIAVEWWPDDFDAILYATLRGVVVVEAGGNGAEGLDDAIYSTRPAEFPSTWTNPFNRNNRDAGAILVGAGAPPPGTHGRSHGPDRSRLEFSNYGSSIDVQGWGREVTTCGYADLQGGSDEDRWYTDSFSGTSSASPIVVGALGCVQGALRAANGTLLTPATARQLLRSTGSAQQDAPDRPATQRIGTRPNLRQMLEQVIGVNPPVSAPPSVKDVASSSEVVINVQARRVTVNVLDQQ